MDKTMQRPLNDVLAFASLLISLHTWLEWLLHNEPYFKAVGSLGAAVIVVWRLGVLGRRTFVRWRSPQRTLPEGDDDDPDQKPQGTS